MRILMVDDVKDMRVLFRTMLESLGHEVLEAENGERAIQVSLAEKPDLILMDLRMPLADGLLGTGALRSISGFGSVPIIAVTADYSQKAKKEASAAGCDDCIGKPVTRDQLADVISRYRFGRSA